MKLEVIAGPDDKDSTCLEAKYRPSVDYVVALEQRKDLRGIRIGIPKVNSSIKNFIFNINIRRRRKRKRKRREL
jgi:Asp-tRNA(Asn)/Glu-tRNA(Gln) amidotransferase A subunit family amidase